MDEFPNPDDEFDMMYQDDMEAMRDMEDFDVEAAEAEAALIPPSIKRSLNFTSPVSVKAPAATNNAVTPSQTQLTQASQQSSNGIVQGTTQLEETLASGRKRPALDEFDDDIAQFLNDDFTEGRKKRKQLLPEVTPPPGFQDPMRDLETYDADLALIDRIVEMRKKLRDTKYLETIQAETSHVTDRIKHTARVHRRLPDGDFQAITMESGERFYLDRIEEDELDRQITNITATHKTLCLLNVPYERLKAQAEQEKIRQDERRAKSMQEAEDSGMESGHEDDSDDAKESLWVERYKPRRYLDLLSDESTNRTVLRWVKLWDKLVFGIEKKAKQPDQKPKAGNFPSKFPSKFPKKYGPEVITELDEQGRPAQKAILLCGPPGLGKTTLAHIIARHAGYNPVEMNASDDRSVDVFRKNMENATSMKAVLGAEKRPNCLIIDEIDGAPAPSINWLVNLLSGKAVAGGGAKKKKKKDSIMALHRPVICICNELYTPALRPLRQLALVIQFPPTHSTRLAHRLSEICRKRHFKADLTVLLALCDKMENDIRGCLSVLQFVRSTRNNLRLRDVDTSAIGQKDYQRSLFKVWHDIFTIPRPKQKRVANPHELEHVNGVLVPMPDLNGDLDNIGDLNTLAYRYQRILRTTESCGEYEKLTQGWFENYPEIKFKHLTMEPVTNGLEWAIFTDVVQKEIMHSQSWMMMAFLPYSCVAYHLLFATHQWPKIRFPSQMSEMNQKIIKTKSLLASMINDMNPLTRAFAGNQPLVTDILPLLLHIIQPNLRPVNTQLYSKKEREELFALIDTMISYNITYTQERNLDGQYSFNLDPNVEEVVRFPDIKPEKQLSYATRQLISREVELEKVRRAETYFAKQKADEQAKMKVSEDERKKKKESSESGKVQSPAVPNHLQKLQPKPIAENSVGKKGDRASLPDVATAPRDFFGRIIERHSNQEVKTTTNEIVKSDIWFKFKEGFSNAVRRRIKIKDIV